MKQLLGAVLFVGLVGCGQADQPSAETEAFDLADALAERGLNVPTQEAVQQGLAMSTQANIALSELDLEAADLSNASDLEALLEKHGIATGTIDAQKLLSSAQEKEALLAALNSIKP